MRTITVLNRISIDGFFAGPNGEIDWFIPDPEVDRAVHDAGSADTLLLGRNTFQLFEKSWPPFLDDPNAPPQMKAVAEELTKMKKIVFSKTLQQTTWANTEFVADGVIEKVTNLKAGEGTGMMMFGSGEIIQQLSDAGLIDEYLFIVTPVVLGKGKALFKDVNKVSMKLADTQSFASGNVLLHYKTR